MTRKTLLVFLSFLLATGINARSVGLFGHDKLDVSDTVRLRSIRLPVPLTN